MELNGIYRKIKNPEFQKKLTQIIRQKESEAKKLGLSPEKPAQKPLSKDEFRDMQRRKSEVNRFNNQIFKPVKDKLREDYGEQAATFIFSNRIIEQIVEGDNSELKEYKIDLLKTYSERLEIDRSTLNELLS